MRRPGSANDPLWYKDAIVYELHVRSFFDSTDDGTGDFPGLTMKLDYLQDLGITCLWLLPFYPSPLKDDGYDIARYDDIANSMTFLLEQSRMAEPDASLDTLNAAAARLIDMEGMTIVSDTYSNLTGSGDLSIIRSQELKDAMASFFGRYDVLVLVGNTHEMQLVGIFQPYIVDNLDYVGMLDDTRGVTPSAAFAPNRIRTALRTDEFRNVVAVKWDIVTDFRDVMTIALDEARRAEALLSEELERR